MVTRCFLNHFEFVLEKYLEIEIETKTHKLIENERLFIGEEVSWFSMFRK